MSIPLKKHSQPWNESSCFEWFHRSGQILIGQYLVLQTAALEDIKLLYSSYRSELGTYLDPFCGFPHFVKCWKYTKFSLIHMVAPHNSGRHAFHNYISSIFLSFSCSQESFVSNTNCQYENNLKLTFAIYGIYFLRITAPAHCTIYEPLRIECRHLAHLVKNCGYSATHYSHILFTLLHERILVLSAWTGGFPNPGGEMAEHLNTSHRSQIGLSSESPEWTRSLQKKNDTHSTNSLQSSALAAADLSRRALSLQVCERVPRSLFIKAQKAAHAWSSLARPPYILTNDAKCKLRNEYSLKCVSNLLDEMQMKSKERLRILREDVAEIVSSGASSDRCVRRKFKIKGLRPFYA